MLATIVWQPDPIAFSCFGFDIRWYSLCWCCALMAGYFVMAQLYKYQRISKEKFEPLFLYIFIGVLVGARLGHCLFYEPAYYLNHIVEMLLPIKQDAYGKWHLVGYEGLASHGGVIGMIAAIVLYSRKCKINLMRVLDNMGIVAPISAAFIRIGNLFNSEIVGHPTDMPWGFIFVHNNESFPRHPAQLYEAIFYTLLFVVTLIIYKKRNSRIGTGFFFGLCLTTIFSFRILVEFFKDNQVGFENAMILNMGQLLSIPLVAVGVYCMAHGKWCAKLSEKQ